MKNFILLTLLSSFALVSCGLNFGDVNDCNEICDTLMASDDANDTAFANNGDCVSLCATCSNPSESTGTLAVCICNYYDSYLESAGLDWDDLGLKNKGQCVKAVKDVFDTDL